MTQRPMVRFDEDTYVLSFPRPKTDCELVEIAKVLKERLPESRWYVSTHKDTIEIMQKEEFGARRDAAVYPAVREVVGLFDIELLVVEVMQQIDREGSIEEYEVNRKDAEFPVEVIDQKDGLLLVKCAVISQNERSLWVKPLCSAQFERRDLGSDCNRGFHMSWWQIERGLAQESTMPFSTVGLPDPVLAIVLNWAGTRARSGSGKEMEQANA